MRQSTLAGIVISSTLLFGLRVAVLAQTIGAGQSPPAPIGKLVDVGGYRVHLYCTGSGSPTVVIVGAGFTFDWGLVQPEVAKFTRVCSYDHSGTGWSEDGPKDSCSLRVNEVHMALKNAGIEGPYVLVGHSLGALVARLYGGQHPDELAGIVFVDHAMGFGMNMGMRAGPPSLPPPNAGPVGSAHIMKSIGLEDDPNFSKLSAQERGAHLWFVAQPRTQKAMRTNSEIMPGCFADADELVKGHTRPLGDKPLVDVDTNESAGAELQKQLLSLSGNAKEMTAENSGHFIIIDRPDVVVEAIGQVVSSARNKTPL
jgi:pimeloyl-ACP methyl ester carboxylesterase